MVCTSMKRTILLNVDLLERARLSAGLLKSEVAHKAGISRNAVYLAFSKGQAGVLVARGIAKALGIPLNGLWVEA